MLFKRLLGRGWNVGGPQIAHHESAVFAKFLNLALGAAWFFAFSAILLVKWLTALVNDDTMGVDFYDD